MNLEQLPPAMGKFASTVKVGEKGQIVIPKGARDLFGIKPGDTLLLLADADQGIAIVRQDLFDRFIAQAMPPSAGPSTGSGEDAEQEDERP
jgi:AbrB family looped-hinge helix DNA binding protein